MDNKIEIPVVSKCKKPIRLQDPRGGVMYVPCGHCQPCEDSYRSKWMQRLDCETKSSAATLFFTLTYDNIHVPALIIVTGKQIGRAHV